VKQPLINVEENIDRWVGRRAKTPDALSTATSNKADSIAWRKALGGVRVPRGVHRFDGVPIPFASPRLLWRMKAGTHREKDAGDLVFLRQWFAQRGQDPPRL
jgi:hypothetical protein